jgi:hypothetical protein
MKFLIATLLATVALTRLAHADEDLNERKGLVGADFEFLPTGSVTANFAGGNDTTADTATAYGITGYFESQIDEHVTVGLAPRYVFAVNTANSNSDSANMLDLRARVTAGAHVAPKLRVYGFAMPGWSIIFPPSSVMVNNNSVHPNGFVIDVGGGASYHLSSGVRAYVELGYQWGFQSWSASGTVLGQTVTVTGDDKVNYLQLGFGLQVAVD